MGAVNEGQYTDVPIRRPRRSPIRGARLNANYCLVRLTYLQAQMLYLAAEPMKNETPSEIGWSGAEFYAFQQALDKLGETAERWPVRVLS